VRQKEFDACWDKIILVLIEEKPDTITAVELTDMVDYLEELHEKADRCDTLEGEIVNLKHTINRL